VFPSSISVLAGLGVLASSGVAESATRCSPPAWKEIPTASDLAAVYPERARKEGVGGRAVLRCTTRMDGVMTDCRIDSEDPVGYGFGSAALALASKVRAVRPCAGSTETQPGGAVLPIRFVLPPAPPYREAAFKTPDKAYRWLAPAGPYWPAKALDDGRGAVVTVDCRVDDRSYLSSCRLIEETTPGLHFGQAVLRMAQAHWMTAASPPPDVATPEDGLWRFQIEFTPHSMHVRAQHPIYAPQRADVR